MSQRESLLEVCSSQQLRRDGQTTVRCTLNTGHIGPHSYTVGYGGVVTAKEQLEKFHEVDHYTQGSVECIDAIRSALTPEEFRGYCKGQIIKYVWRERHKAGNADLEKALDYLKWGLE